LSSSMAVPSWLTWNDRCVTKKLCMIKEMTKRLSDKQQTFVCYERVTLSLSRQQNLLHLSKGLAVLWHSSSIIKINEVKPSERRSS
jgi:hypothetical protein